MTAPARHARAAADLRLLRAAVFTAVCVVLAATGHMAGSLASVPLWTLAAGCGVVLVVAAPLAGRERSLPGIAAALTVGQLALHALFSAGQHCAVPVAAGGGRLDDATVIALARRLTCGLDGVRLGGDAAHRIVAQNGFDPSDPRTAEVLGTGGADGMAGMGHLAGAPMAHSVLPSLPMLLGHLLAALAAGWLLRRGEAALWRLIRLSAPVAHEAAAQALAGALRSALALVRALLAGLPGHRTGPTAPLAHAAGPSGPEDPALLHSVVRRGPPAVAPGQVRTAGFALAA
ncbi:hypothetical protein [Streptomyces catenulae]|uniref:Integral membrane protein n=1 Tax=Streptomyces catenulae TaxID=66875 RepID=A0ABV2Z1T7_9ACTN|nr:hypothetical protein [Streptomyces catenulae]